MIVTPHCLRSIRCNVPLNQVPDRQLSARSVEVATRVAGKRLAVTIEFEEAGDIVRKRKAEQGIEIRPGRACSFATVGRCNCRPGYRPRVWDAAAGPRGRWINGPTFDSIAAARNWRQDTAVAVRRGARRAPTEATVASAAQDLLVGMRSRAILSSARTPYRPADDPWLRARARSSCGSGAGAHAFVGGAPA